MDPPECDLDYCVAAAVACCCVALLLQHMMRARTHASVQCARCPIRCLPGTTPASSAAQQSA
jgi:hypothetical protein